MELLLSKEFIRKIRVYTESASSTSSLIHFNEVC